MRFAESTVESHGVVAQDLNWVVNGSRTVSYDVIGAHDLFSPDNDLLLSRGFKLNSTKRRCLVVIDENVQRLYGDSIQSYFDHHAVEATVLPLFSMEAEKRMDKVFEIMAVMQACDLTRRSEPLIGVGGGVLLDMVGLAASMYRRGTPYIRVPTTLMGLVDAGVGIKTGVNFEQHKNRVGTYYAPIAAFLDRKFLDTLDERHLSNGLAEILKIALVKDIRLFELMEHHGPDLIDSRLQGHANYDEIFRRAIQGMLEELEPNLWEDTLERLVDYGHSFSPFIEMEALPKLLHGEAVSIDMAFSLVLAKRRGLLRQSDLERVLTLMQALDLPLTHSLVTPDFMAEALNDTVQHRDGRQRLPLTVGIGDCQFVNDVSFRELEATVAEHRDISASFEHRSA